MTLSVDQWLEIHAPGYVDLSHEERAAIRDFSLLWSLFEAKSLACNASAARIQGWVADNAVTIADFANELSYFRQRYFADGDFTGKFSGLKLRTSDKPDLVKAVLSEDGVDGAGQVAAIFIIILRLRNNLFLGSKWSYGIRDQLDNFEHANRALMKVLSL